MSAIINQFNGTYVEHIDTYIQNQYNTPSEVKDVPTDEPVTSNLFTKKARQEKMEDEIVQALQRSLSGRQDKARALVEEVRQ